MNTAKIVLITGASTGFGRDTAETLARAGHRVFASMRGVDAKNREHADELRSVAASTGVAITPIELDVTSDASVEHAVAAVLRTTGRIDVLVNNAGIASAGVSESFTPSQVRDLFEVNVIGVHRVTRAVLPVLRRQRDGLIVNVGSVLGRVTLPFFGIYGASKFALEALTESYRYELSELGIDVSLVQPSAYPTQMYSNVQVAIDAGRASEYGEVGAIPAAMFQHFMDVFRGPEAPDPHEVGAAIARLIDAPRAKRATRTIVGAPFGADTVNAQTAPVQAEVVRSLGLGHLDTSAA
jgi:NAD(P)-dependent dehydrogenase (short-subunit alcohol dehydrogenase family)